MEEENEPVTNAIDKLVQLEMMIADLKETGMAKTREDMKKLVSSAVDKVFDGKTWEDQCGEIGEDEDKPFSSN
jgi:hypothetical protein